jgi:thiamine biosynthesis lipoprotein
MTDESFRGTDRPVLKYCEKKLRLDARISYHYEASFRETQSNLLASSSFPSGEDDKSEQTASSHSVRFQLMSESQSQPTGPDPDRRDFLTARPIREQVASQVSELESSESEQHKFRLTRARGAAECWLQHFTHRAMACDFQVFLNLGQDPQGPEAVLEAFALVDELEDRFSIFRGHSELTRVNQFAAQIDVPVESDLFGLLQMAETLHEETAGAFDISTTALSKAWNFFSRQPAVPSADAIAAALKNVGQKNLQLDPEQRSVRFSKPGIELNLHSIGKGFAVRRMAEHLQQRGLHDFVIHGGQSSVLAIGDCLPRETEQGGWRIGLTHPVFPEKRLGEFLLTNRAIGTSGSARQGLVHRGQRLGHILDPRTGWPANHWLSTTVLHPDPTHADALATAFYVMSEAEIIDYCRSRPDLAALNIRSLGNSRQIELRLFRVDPQQLQLAEPFANLPRAVVMAGDDSPLN